jgi:2-polyprenyl-3-methyl-5-hydroxy-6-metoxy-1,4-benzoquinol methylase
MKHLLKKAALAAVGVVSGRYPVLLPTTAAPDAQTLDVIAPYRVESGLLHLQVQHAGRGTLQLELLGYDGFAPSLSLWQSTPMPYVNPTILEFDLESATLRMNGVACPGGSRPAVVPRRFCWRFELRTDDGLSFTRLTGHYRPVEADSATADYFEGNNYVDYESESASTRTALIELVDAYPITGTALEVGCATGGVLLDLRSRGIDAVGVDFSEWAVARARERLGDDSVWAADLNRTALPPDLAARGPFGALILLSVLEHFADPQAVLARLDRVAVPGTRLYITTTNADSLSHQLFGRDWEGYFDWTHRGIEHVTATSLSQWLTELGWRIEMLQTYMIWSGNIDPLHGTLREWWTVDARFRHLVVQKGLGDLITCVATRQ